MKKLLIYIVISAILFSSCKKFLDLNPTDQPSSETFWKTPSDLDLALTACYGSLQHPYFSYSLPTWDNLTDNGYGQHAEGQYGFTTNIVQGNIDPSSAGFITELYAACFSGVTRTNIFLKNLKDFTGISEESKKNFEGEARMLRAFFYSYLYRCYGAVPIVREPLNLETQYQPKAAVEEVYDFMMEDLDFAIANLRDLTYKESKGHWTQNAARAYKARMILYTAYDKAGTAISSKMTQALDVLTKITGYSLAPEFSDNFQDLHQENSPEIMFSVKFLAPNNATSADMWYGDWIVVSPLPNLIGEFEMKDGSASPPVPYTGKGIVDLSQFNNTTMKSRDPRLEKTVFIDKYIVNGISYTPSNVRPLNTGLSKFLSLNLIPPYDYGTRSEQDWVLMRYADVLAMKAEAENEISGPTNTVYTSINAIRNRAGMPPLPLGLSKEAMRLKIRHERRVEFAFEGTRYFDLKRWRIAEQVLNNVKDGLVTYQFLDKHYLWPLPQNEIDKSHGVLVQNPNYK